MARYSIRHFFNLPSLVSLTRVPLAVAFTQVSGSVTLSLLTLAAAGLSDVVDGFIARRYGMATPTGAVVDGATDKIFAATVLVTLALTDRLALESLFLLGTREIVELPLVLWLVFHPAARLRRIDERANLFGKAATTLQFGTVVAILARRPLATVTVAVWLTAIVGAAAGFTYWRRMARAPAAARSDGT